MSPKKKIPKRLYKYRSFSSQTLDQLIGDQLFFADPITFNDPLDAKPTLDTDLDADDLAEVLRKLVEQRIRAEMMAAAKAIKYRGPKTKEHIERHSRREAQQAIEEVRYRAADSDYEMERPDQFLFGRYVEIELLRRYDKGIFSLAERSDCPLMWSHYGDQHKGVCIGYSVPERTAENLHKVTYGGSRLVAASAVAKMLDGSVADCIEVDEAVLTRKAEDWRYECEWRLIGSRGSNSSPLELEEIVFGMRCSDTVRYAIVRAFTDRKRPVKFYEMRECRGEFTLDKVEMETGEMLTYFPVRSLFVQEAFSNVRSVE